MRLPSRPSFKPALMLAVLAGLASSQAGAQGPDGPPAGLVMSESLMAMVRDLNAPQTPLPAQPTAVALPTLSAKITGPGAMYESAPAQWPGRDMKFYKYVANEYFVSGTAGGKPYTTRVVVRQPADNAKFSGIVVAESMHPIGGAHAFEYNSVYLMDAGHVTVEIATVNAALFAGFNAQRYKDIKTAPGQTNEILAQVGALVRSAKGPLAGLPVRKVLLWGTSATSGLLVNYLPAHKIYKTPDMKNIFDGFMPTSNGSTIKPVDVPMIQVPTQHEYGNIATAEQDSDKAGSPFRVYEVAGLAHLDARNNGARFNQSHCANPLTKFPNEAYMSVTLHHLVQWVDKGTVPPKADRVWADFNVTNDGSLMLLDENGNPRGGIRNPYVDVPVAKYAAVNTATQAALSSKAGVMGPALLCTLSAWETPIPAARLKQLYGTKDAYVKKFEARLNELEKAGWSLPVYHDLILADAKAVNF
ncbi:MAG: hypothetical protein RLZZ403_942 [Pseudomonadota bacterium]